MVPRFWRVTGTTRQGRRERQYAGILARLRTPHGGSGRRQKCSDYCWKGHYPSEKITEYEAELFEVFFSCGTGATSTLTVVLVANCTCPRFRKTTCFCSPGLIRSIVLVWTIGLGDCWMVSVTLICTSCESPVSSTVTAKPRSVVAVTVFSVV